MTSGRVLFSILGLLLMSQAIAQQAMVGSSAPVSLGMSLQGQTFTLDVQVTAPATVSVFCPMTPGLISFSGLTEKVETTYDQKSRVLQLALPPGKYKVSIRSF